jgi:hypothetical protein
MNKLEKFLRENNAWDAFKKNYDPDYTNNNGISFHEFMFLNGYNCMALRHAFSWAYNPEGIDYWNELHCKWYVYLKNEEEMNNEKEFEFKVGDRVMIEGVLEKNPNQDDYPLLLKVGDEFWKTLTIDGKLWHDDNRPILKLIERPKPKLTFQFIRENLVPMKHLLIDEHGDKRLYLGFTKTDHLAVDSASLSPFNVSIWSEPDIQNWTYEECKE